MKTAKTLGVAVLAVLAVLKKRERLSFLILPLSPKEARHENALEGGGLRIVKTATSVEPQTEKA